VDLTPPTVVFLSPAENALISSTATIEATATDNFNIAKVEFYLNNELLGQTTSSPYKLDFNTTIYPNGKYSLKAVAYDEAGNQSQTVVVVEVANNVVTPLGGSIIYPDGLLKLDFPPGLWMSRP